MEQVLRHPWVLQGLDVERLDPSSTLPLVRLSLASTLAVAVSCAVATPVRLPHPLSPCLGLLGQLPRHNHCYLACQVLQCCSRQHGCSLVRGQSACPCAHTLFLPQSLP